MPADTDEKLSTQNLFNCLIQQVEINISLVII